MLSLAARFSPLAQAETPEISSGLDDWVKAVIVFAVAVVVATIARAGIGRLGRRRGAVSSTVQIVGRLSFAILLLVGIYIALRTIGLDLGPLVAGAGILGIALAFAVQDIAENYLSGVILGFRNPFRPGDQIESGEHEGTVEELNLRHTTIRGYDGVRAMLPNGQVLKNPLINLTVNGTRRSDFTLGVAYGSDLEEAMQVARDAAGSVDGVVDDPAPEAWVEELAASSINLRVRFWHAPRTADMWRIRSETITAVVAGINAAGIEIPFEQRVVTMKAPVEQP